MIDKIGNFSKVQLNTPAFKSGAQKMSESVSNPINYEMKGLETLAGYNKFFVANLNLKPIPLLVDSNNVNQIKGEKIYSSDGKLHSIVDDTNGVRTVYRFDSAIENLFESASKYDSKTGNLLMKQMGFDSVVEYDPINGKIVSSTEYEGEKPVFISKHKYRNGVESEICKDFEANKYYVYEVNRNTGDSLDASFDKNKQIQSLRANTSKGLTSEFFNIDFYNGSMISASRNTSKTVPNMLGRESMDLENLEPHSKFNISDKDLSSYQGEKTYYSNGFIETNTMDLDYGNQKVQTTCFFEPQGRLSKILVGNKEIIIDDNENQEILEFLADGSLKETRYLGDSCIVSVQSPSLERSVWYDNGNISSYHDDKKSLYFNKFGMLEDAIIKDE